MGQERLRHVHAQDGQYLEQVQYGQVEEQNGLRARAHAVVQEDGHYGDKVTTQTNNSWSRINTKKLLPTRNNAFCCLIGEFRLIEEQRCGFRG